MKTINPIPCDTVTAQASKFDIDKCGAFGWGHFSNILYRVASIWRNENTHVHLCHSGIFGRVIFMQEVPFGQMEISVIFLNMPKLNVQCSSANICFGGYIDY